MRGIALSLLLVGVGASCGEENPDIGRPCDAEMPCPPDMHCLADYTGNTVCMEACAATDDTLCGDFSVCLDTTLGTRACYPGGPLDEGDVCTINLDCERGGLCVRVEGEAEAHCFRACDVGSGTSRCLSGERCAATVDGDGFCVSL